MKTLIAKYPGNCNTCGVHFAAGDAIVYNGKAHHAACAPVSAAERLARQKTAQDEAAAESRVYAEANRAWRADRKAGLHATVTLTDTAIVVRNAWDYAQASDLAFALVQSASAATGIPMRIRSKRRANGKLVIGREITIGGHGGGMSYHDGYAFDLAGTK